MRVEDNKAAEAAALERDLEKVLRVQVGFQKLLSHCLEIEEEKRNSRPQEPEKRCPRRWRPR